MPKEEVSEEVREYFRRIGRKGGKKSKRNLSPEEARRMRECRTDCVKSDSPAPKKSRPNVGPKCVRCDHLSEDLECSLEKCNKEQTHV